MKQKTKIIDLDNEYYFWKSEISHENCQRLINLGEGNWKTAKTRGLDAGLYEKDSVRKSDVVWVTDQWVYDLIWKYMQIANQTAGWKYNIVAAESVQITRYTKGGFYSWHKDGIGSHNTVCNEPDNKFLHGNTRKLSMSILLNDDYEGGHFQISADDRKDLIAPVSEKGAIIVFPSFIEHQVTPVTKGTRYSLVTWFVGSPFV